MQNQKVTDDLKSRRQWMQFAFNQPDYICWVSPIDFLISLCLEPAKTEYLSCIE